jgi:hypothetical protein
VNQADRSSIHDHGHDRNAAPSSLSRWQRPLWLGALVALVVAGLGAYLDLTQFWRSYLLAYLYWLALSLGCLGMVMLHHVAGGRWSAHIRRLMEAGAMTLPLMAVLFVPLLVGLRTLYPWSNPEVVAESELVANKALYLNVPFFVGRAVFYFAGWLGLAILLNRWSMAQDRTGEARWGTRLCRLSAVGLVFYVLTATFAAYDWMMSLEPEWFSSIYGLLVIAGQGAAALSLAIIGLRWLAKETAGGEEWTQSFNDLGNLLLAFVMIWAYFSFSQFLIIWSANIPEEAIWYVHRSQGGWLVVGMVLIAVHFAIPFFLLLSRRVKRRANMLTVLAVLILAARWVDMVWLIVPAFYPDGVHVHWLDLVLLAAIGLGWLALFIGQLSAKASLPRYDPHLAPVIETNVETDVMKAKAPTVS